MRVFDASPSNDMLGEHAAAGGYGRPDEEYASENTKRFTVDSLLQIRRPGGTVIVDDKRPVATALQSSSYDVIGGENCRTRILRGWPLVVGAHKPAPKIDIFK